MSRTTEVELRPDDNRDLVVRLTSGSPDADGFGVFDVFIEAEGVRAEHGVLTYRGDGLDTFFDSLAADWKGWDGTRKWEAIEGGLTIEASHHGSRVELLLILRRDHNADAWQLRIPIRVAPGETLRHLAEATARLVAPLSHS